MLIHRLRTLPSHSMACSLCAAATGVTVGLIAFIAFIAVTAESPANAQEVSAEEMAQAAAETKQAAQVKTIEEDAGQIASDMAVLRAFVRDEDLAKDFAPEGWERPEFEVYEATLDGRPSLLPYENFMQAVKAGACPAEEGEAYKAWVGSQPAE